MARLMRDGLAHKNMFGNDSKFFELIDSTGGWPIGYEFVGFEHTTDRAAGFTNSQHNDGWWTVLNSADDYYLWKVSPAAIQRLVDAAVNAARITSVQAPALWVKNSRGHRLELAKAQP